MKNLLHLLLCLLISAVAYPSLLFATNNLDLLVKKDFEYQQSNEFLTSINNLNNTNLALELKDSKPQKAFSDRLSDQDFIDLSIDPQLSLELSTKALIDYQLGHLEQAESELRSVIQDNPMHADARAALSALLWRKGSFGEAQSHWVAASGLDSRYRQREWLLNYKHWPPEPINDLLTFLDMSSKWHS